MIVNILKEAGYEEALLGLSLSYGTSIERAKQVSLKLYNKGLGHSKFLESIYVWIDINAPRFWWSEADTYRLSTKQSESTMHTLMKRSLSNKDFEYPISKEYLYYLNDLIKNTNFVLLKNSLPEGFLQRRIWVVNYKTLRNIIAQRKNHKLIEWQYFCARIFSTVKHNEYLVDLMENEKT